MNTTVKATVRPSRPRIDLTDRKALQAHDPAAPEVVEEARRIKETVLLDFGIADSAVASWLYSKCHYQIPTTAIPTAAVAATGDGTCMLLYNPDFFVALGPEGVKFILYHEARHLIQRHLYVEKELRSDPIFTVATEVTINHVVLTRLGRTGLPVHRDADMTDSSEQVGIDPRTIHGMYVSDLQEQGLEPLAYREFVDTDMSVYAELRRMTNPPIPPVLCIHMGEDCDGEGVPLDDETVGRLGADVLAEVMRQARNGNTFAREELLEMADRTEGGGDRLRRLWGSLGLAALRGETPATRKVEWWKRWLIDTLASKLRDGERLVYPKKLGAVMLSLGMEPMLSRRGRERVKVVLIAIDTSGSMPDEVVQWLTTLVGQTDGVETHWLSFDGTVMPFVPGQPVLGGGGTSFQNVVDYAEGRYAIDGELFDTRFDAAIMVTDGYAPIVKPRDPDRWIWLITEGGDDWPERQLPPMACHRISHHT
ncbi:DUF2201 family putative metallopeptidase [Stackebrandtia soli]|uniref:DUF2201 family putative metallopeptidase n=1 Tax=Stackebrandtia soli TaxID=1892856 RepID=UPI0039E8B6B5